MQQSNHQFTEHEFVTLPPPTLSGMTTAGQFVLGVMRCWDAFLNDPDPTLAWRKLAPVFAFMNVLGALCAFDAAFNVLRCERLPTLRFFEVDVDRVAAAESRCLDALALLQRGESRAALQALDGLVSATGLNQLLPPFARIAAILDGRGHRLQLSGTAHGRR